MNAKILAIVLIALAACVAGQEANPFECNFNVPDLKAGAEAGVCKIGRVIGRTFFVDMTISSSSPVGTPDWTFVIYYSNGQSEELQVVKKKGHVTIDVSISGYASIVDRINLKNKNSVFAIQASGKIRMNDNKVKNSLAGISQKLVQA
ncbi:dpnC [Acrasis kona]|uniref:DpnC n=1 Tax=Acrasis kona TaxID=1008807 RepID=A0AAW2YRY9_9EUKA